MSEEICHCGHTALQHAIYGTVYCYECDDCRLHRYDVTKIIVPRATPPTGEQADSALDAVLTRASYLTVDNGAPGEPEFEQATIDEARAELRTLRASLAAARAQAFEEAVKIADETAETWANAEGQFASGHHAASLEIGDRLRAASEGGRT